MFDEQRGDNLFDRQFVVVRQAVNLFPILQEFNVRASEIKLVIWRT